MNANESAMTHQNLSLEFKGQEQDDFAVGSLPASTGFTSQTFLCLALLA